MSTYYRDEQVTLLLGNALEVLRTLPDESVNCCVTSPPYYGLRDYGVTGQYGLEASVGDYVETMRAVFAEVRRVLAADGTLWLNLGDSYSAAPSGPPGKSSALLANRSSRIMAEQAKAGKKADRPHKNLLGIPWRITFALQDDGWVLRNDIIWYKPNAMPESVTDRLAGRHEHLFLLAKNQRYYFSLDAIREPHSDHTLRYYGPGVSADQRPANSSSNAENGTKHQLTSVGSKGANPGDVWSISTRPNRDAHFATFPVDVPLRCIKAGCKPDGTVLDPFSGSGTTGEAARLLGRRYVGIDLNPAYHDLAVRRFAQGVLDFEAAPSP